MKYFVLVGLVSTMALTACSDDDDNVVNSDVSSEVPPPYTMQVISDDEQRKIADNLALLTAFYAEDFSDHSLILVGDSENLVDDMSCNEHDEAVVERMLGGGNPRFLHLADSTAMTPSNAAFVDENGRYLNQKYRQAPPHIKEAIDYVNQFTGHEGALDDSSAFLFNYSSADGEINNGKCQDLGNHHLGLFKDTKVVQEMNNAGYGTATWNGLPIYGSTVLVDVTIAGTNWKLKINENNGKFFIRKNSSQNYCKQWVYSTSTRTSFLQCTVVYIASSYIKDAL